jgi:prefoldin subunit 5
MEGLTELKAQAYDLIAQIEALQRQLRELNSKILEIASK